MKTPIIKTALAALALALAFALVSCGGSGSSLGATGATGVTISPAGLSMSVGGRATLTAAVQPTDAPDRNVTWASSDASVATVAAAGLTATVSAVGVGQATITVTTASGGKTAACTVTVSAPTATGIALDKQAMALVTGGIGSLTATITPNNALNHGVAWVSSNPAVATVVGSRLDAKVNGISPGAATITVTTLDGGLSASCAVHVTAPGVAVTGVSLDRSSMPLGVGSVGILTASVMPHNATNQSVTWSSSNPAVATIAGSGLSVVVNAMSEGASTITVTTADGAMTASCAVTVTAVAVPVASVSIAPQHLSMYVGIAWPMQATIAPSNATNQSVAWSTSDGSVATVAGSGLGATVTAVGAGQANIVVTTADGGKTAVCVVQVAMRPIAVTGLSLPKVISIGPLGQTQLTADLTPFDTTDRNVAWSSSDSSVATVVGNGAVATVTGLAPGTARITAASPGTPSATDYCDVTVAQSIWREAYLGGDFGIIKNGAIDETYDGNVIYAIAVDGFGVVHAAGLHYNGGIYCPAYFRDGVRTLLPFTDGCPESVGMAIHVTNDGHVYIAGYEYKPNAAKLFTAKLWRDGVEVPLGGVSDYYITEATGVHASGGNVYVTGVCSVDGQYIDGAVLWVNQQMTVFDDQPHWARCVTAAGGDVYVGGGFGMMKLRPSNPKAYHLLQGYENDIGSWGAEVLSVKAVGNDIHAAGWVQDAPVVWKNHAPTPLPWNQDSDYSYASATSVAVGHDGSVYVSGHEIIAFMSYELPHPVLWKDGTKQSIPDFNYSRARAVAVRELPGIAATSVALSSAALDIPVGHSRDLTASISPSDASYQSVVWASDNPAVASVIGTGLTVAIKGLAMGTATITATSPDGPSASCVVNAINIPVTDVSLPAAMEIGLGRSAKLVAAILPLEATNQNMAWSSSNPAVVTVGGTGAVATVTAIGLGTTVVAAVAQDGGWTAYCTVMVLTPAQLGEPTIFIAGGFGLYVDGQPDQAIGDQELNDVLVDDDANIHAAGWYYDYDDDDVYWKAAYYRNGTPSILPMTLPSVDEAGAWGADLAPNGDAYVVGYERGGGVRAARHWKVAPDGSATPLPLPGIIETNYTYSYALAVRVFNGDIYVAGGAEDAGYGEHPVIWKNQVKYEILGHSFTNFRDIGFDPQGTMYVLGSDNHVYTVAPDLSSITRTAFGDAGARLAHIFIDGDDVYAAGYVGNYAHYWKNGQCHPLEPPPGANWTEAGDISAFDGHIYIVGCSYHGYTQGYRTQLWIDGMPIHDDRSIEEVFVSNEKAVANAILVKQMAIIPVTDVELSISAADIPVGYSVEMVATLLPADATTKAVAWVSSDPAVASIVGGGLTVAINGLAVGSATITATSPDGPSAACTVNVIAAAAVPSAGMPQNPAWAGVAPSCAISAQR
jgi:uncharacterized protein YjdB